MIKKIKYNIIVFLVYCSCGFQMIYEKVKQKIKIHNDFK